MALSKHFKFVASVNKSVRSFIRPYSTVLCTPRTQSESAGSASHLSHINLWNRGSVGRIPKISPFNSFAYNSIRISFSNSRQCPVEARDDVNVAEIGEGEEENVIVKIVEYGVLIDPETVVHEEEPLPKGALSSLALNNALPFIGFGFLDNLIMIVAGDYIDSVFGSVLCISTMAAAALGNTLSDVAGIGSTYYIQKFVEDTMGFTPPKLTPEQANKSICRLVVTGGRTIGIVIGCFLGMFPLLFITEKILESSESFQTDASAEPIPQEKKIAKVYSTPTWLRYKRKENKDVESGTVKAKTEVVIEAVEISKKKDILRTDVSAEPLPRM